MLYKNYFLFPLCFLYKKYAFEILKADEVCSIIRDTNIASQKVAIRNGMAVKDSWVKHYRGVDMPHDRYVVLLDHYHRVVLKMVL